METLLNSKQVARLLGVSPRTLERHRAAGTGPRYARFGRLIRYKESDLAMWIRSATYTSTSHGAGGDDMTCKSNPKIPICGSREAVPVRGT